MAEDASAAEAAEAQPEAAEAEAEPVTAKLGEAGKEFIEALGGPIKLESEEEKNSLALTLANLAKRWVEKEMEEDLVGRNVLDEIGEAIDEIDRMLTEQVNAIIHHDNFRKLEGSWRGLEHLVIRTMTTPTLQIRVMNITKDEVGTVFKQWKGKNRLKSPLYYKIYEKMGGMPNGDPFACIVGDYEFDHTKKDIDVLSGMSQICAIAHAPFLAAASPSLVGLDKWQDLQDAMDLEKLMAMPKYAEWNALRDKQDSRYIGLAAPRFVARTPYSVVNNPVDGFAFDEDAEGHDESKYCWSNAAYGIGANITRAFTEYGWCAAIQGYYGGGKVDDLPFHTFPNIEGGTDVKCPTEVAIARSQEFRLSELGLMPLCYWTNTTDAVFVGAQSLKKPQKYEEVEANESEILNCRLPYMFSCCRFAHYLTRMCYAWVGMNMEAAEIEQKLNDWMVKYKLPNPAKAPEAQKHKQPLADFSVTVKPVPGQIGQYDATFELRPHFKLEKLGAKLTLVSRVSKPGA